MKYFSFISKVFVLLIFVFVLGGKISFAAIVDGMPASYLLGQYENSSVSNLIPSWDRGIANAPVDSFQSRTFTGSYGYISYDLDLNSEIDEVNHRLFVSDFYNNRVLVFNLNEDNLLDDYYADYVLGQSDFVTVSSGGGMNKFSSQSDMVFDEDRNYLFVADSSNYRVLVFDVNEITNGENAINVLGQPDFVTKNITYSQSGGGHVTGVDYDAENKRLFVLDFGRVLVFDVNEITNGENAINVIGRPDYTTNYETSSANINNIVYAAYGIVFDSNNQRLFVAQARRSGTPQLTGSWGRITVYDVDPSVLIPNVTNGPNAINVIGQANFTSLAVISNFSNFTNSKQIADSVSLTYDLNNDRLFVSQGRQNRITVYDADPSVLIPNDTSTDYPEAINVLGQTDFLTKYWGVGQNKISLSIGLDFDNTNNRLFASQKNRILIFDVNEITNGENAVGVIGQYKLDENHNLIPAYDKNGLNDSPNSFGFSFIEEEGFLVANNKLFVSDNINNRILIFNLNEDSLLDDYYADYVLGFSDFYTSDTISSVFLTQYAKSDNNLYSPRGLAFDSNRNYLFVADYSNHRVLVFDINDIVSGESAINVLGQADFVTATSGVSQTKMNGPRSVVYDNSSKRLFVADSGNHRVLVFDMNEITNGESASNVLGQADFVTGTSGVSQTKINNPSSLFYDTLDNKLFISDAGNHRVLVFDVVEITNGEGAINVLGQNDFTTNTSGVSQTKMYGPRGVFYDNPNKRLFVADTGSHRILVFDLNETTNGEGAINVLGQNDFTTNTSGVSQTKLINPTTVFLDQDNNRLITKDSLNHRILFYNLSDTTPTSFSFTDLEDQQLNTIIESNEIEVEGVDDNVDISIDGCDTTCSYSINGGEYTSENGTVVLGDLVKVRQLSSTDEKQETSMTLNIGDVTDTFSVETGDFTPPVITLTGSRNLNIYVNGDYEEMGATASDNIDGDITEDIVTTGSVDTGTIGTYYISYNVSDQASNQAEEVTRTVNVNKRPATGFMMSQTQLQNIIPTPQTTNITTTPQLNPQTFNFTQTKLLKFKTTDPDVKTLQKFLNEKGFTVSISGPGSLGNETNFFGLKTKQALIKFQQANNLTPDGIFGPKTREKVNELNGR